MITCEHMTPILIVHGDRVIAARAVAHWIDYHYSSLSSSSGLLLLLTMGRASVRMIPSTVSRIAFTASCSAAAAAKIDVSATSRLVRTIQSSVLMCISSSLSVRVSDQAGCYQLIQPTVLIGCASMCNLHCRLASIIQNWRGNDPALGVSRQMFKLMVEVERRASYLTRKDARDVTLGFDNVIVAFFFIQEGVEHCHFLSRMKWLFNDLLQLPGVRGVTAKNVRHLMECHHFRPAFVRIDRQPSVSAVAAQPRRDPHVAVAEWLNRDVEVPHRLAQIECTHFDSSCFLCPFRARSISTAIARAMGDSKLS